MLITLCNGNECTLKENCFRFKRAGVDNMPTIIGKDYPVFFNPPFDGEKCKEFWSLENGK